MNSADIITHGPVSHRAVVVVNQPNELQSTQNNKNSSGVYQIYKIKAHTNNNNNNTSPKEVTNFIYIDHHHRLRLPFLHRHRCHITAYRILLMLPGMRRKRMGSSVCSVVEVFSSLSLDQLTLILFGRLNELLG